MTRVDIANRLSDLRNEIRSLGDEPALTYISHAIDCHHKGQDQAVESWLQMAIDRMAQMTEREVA